jgi:uncharacterized protein
MAILKAVIDTNVLVSGIIQEKGTPHRLINEWLTGKYDLVTSFYLVNELKHVLTYPRLVKRLALRKAEIAIILNELSLRAIIVAADPPFPQVTRDAKDDGVIATALEAKVDYIVSGDQDLLVLGDYQGIRIVTPAQFQDVITAL